MPLRGGKVGRRCWRPSSAPTCSSFRSTISGGGIAITSFLQTSFRRARGWDQPDRLPALHGRSGEWFARNDQLTEAIHHAIAAGDFERVAILVELVARATVRKSNLCRR